MLLFDDVIVTMTLQWIAGQVDCDVVYFYPSVNLLWDRFDAVAGQVYSAQMCTS